MNRVATQRARLTPLLRIVAAFVSAMLAVGNVAATAHLASAAHRFGLDHRDAAQEAADARHQDAGPHTDHLVVDVERAGGPTHGDGPCVASILSQQHATALGGVAVLLPCFEADGASAHAIGPVAPRPSSALFRLAPKLSPTA